MFRRGGPLRPRPLWRLARAAGILDARPRQTVNQAHLLEAAGRHADAAARFTQVADLAAQLGVPDRAGNLSMQAARCYLAAGDVPAAVTRARSGLRLLVQAGREHRAAIALQMTTDALRSRGHAAEADALLKEFGGLAQEAGAEPAEASAPAHGHLPPKCASCGGPLRADDVDWIDDVTAECPYCGSGVRTES